MPLFSSDIETSALRHGVKFCHQAVLGPAALDLVRGSSDAAAVANAQVVFVVSVLSILLTAPIGAVLIATTGPRLLQQEPTPEPSPAATPAATPETSASPVTPATPVTPAAPEDSVPAALPPRQG